MTSSNRSKMDNSHCGLLIAATSMVLAMSAPAHAQNGEKRDSVARDALDAATQPLADINIVGKDVPPILVLAQADPYGLDGLTDCPRIYTAIALLDEVLGADADEEKERGSIASSALRAGGNMLGGFIPFRGVVRQLSGANSRERELEAAIYSGVARRSFLKGYAMGVGCPPRKSDAVINAEEVLGMPLDIALPEDPRTPPP